MVDQTMVDLVGVPTRSFSSSDLGIAPSNRSIYCDQRWSSVSAITTMDPRDILLCHAQLGRFSSSLDRDPGA